MPTFSNASMQKLTSCDERLVCVFVEVVNKFDCTVLEGHRSLERQLYLYNKGASKVKVGRHNTNPSQAVDVAPYPINWHDYERFYFFGGYVLGIAEGLGVELRWGGDWDGDKEVVDQTFNDLVHFEIVT